MNITTLSERLRAIKIVPVIALDNAADAVPLGAALRESGIPVAEITFRPPSKPPSNTALTPSNTSRQKRAAASPCSKPCSRPTPC